MTKKILLAASLLAGIASPASAANLMTDLGSTATFAAPVGVTIDFDNALPADFLATYSSASIVSGNQLNQYAQPAFSDGSSFLAIVAGGAATLQSTIGYESVSFFLGSIDTFNNVQVLNTAGAVIAAYSGIDFTSNANGNQEIPFTNRRITITRDLGGELIGGVRFFSDGQSMEIDNVVFAVPEPSTWALMFLGFGMVGTAMRYRRRSRSVTYA